MSPNTILIDAAHLDFVAFDMIVNFERILGRRVGPADLPQWLDCIALDGGIRPGDNEVQAVFIHDKEQPALKHFAPAQFADELHEKAFRDNLGEFQLTSFPIEPIVGREDFLVQTFEALMREPKVERIMLVADLDGHTPESVQLLNRIKQLCVQPPTTESGEQLPAKDITLFAMAPINGRGFNSEILGYSLTAALGISGGELQG
ncbi:MAG: hypothetical protein HUK09_05910 [Bacteroidaceae bacterium]|nr:hypothetical protein [Bacteroidaceae bacterium]